MTTRPAAPNRRSFLVKAVVAIAVLCLLLFGWRKCSAAQEEESEWDQPPTAVRITPAVQEDLVVRLKALGTVTPLQTVTLRSRVDGELVRLAFQEGQQVKAGDLLAVRSAASVIVEPCGEKPAAFDSRLNRTCRSRRSSASKLPISDEAWISSAILPLTRRSWMPSAAAGQLSTSVVVINCPPCAMPVIRTGLRLARAA